MKGYIPNINNLWHNHHLITFILYMPRWQELFSCGLEWIKHNILYFIVVEPQWPYSEEILKAPSREKKEKKTKPESCFLTLFEQCNNISALVAHHGNYNNKSYLQCAGHHMASRHKGRQIKKTIFRLRLSRRSILTLPWSGHFRLLCDCIASPWQPVGGTNTHFYAYFYIPEWFWSHILLFFH